MAAHSKLLAYLRDCHRANLGDRGDDLSGTPGVLDELSRLAEAQRLSPPLESLLESLLQLERSGADDATPPSGSLPATLSPEQQKAVRAASTRPLSLLVGPPGTGKSYTLATVGLEHVLRGESVLFCAGSVQALRAIESQLRSLVETAIPLAGGADREAFARNLADLLDGELTPDDLWRIHLTAGPEDLGALDEKIAALEEALRTRIELETRWGHLVAGPRPSLFGRLRHAMRRASVERKLAGAPTLESAAGEYRQLAAQRAALVARLVTHTLERRLRRALDGDRATLRHLVEALGAADPPEGERRLESIDPAALLRALPLWLVTFDELPRLLPLAAGIFDLALIDEATQCDLATPLPAMHRARRAMVSGDARQLRHLSFLADDRQREVGERHDLDEPTLAALDYRRRSLLDLVEDRCIRPDRVVRLREHYRSHPAIISFSNRTFYGGSLRIMTRHPGTLRERGLELRRIDGRRRPEGHNPEEIDAVVEEVLRRVGNETLVPDERCHSMGVLSPFRDQVDRLAGELERSLPRRAAARHRLLVGTAHDFQGDERDVMFISFTVDRDASAGTLRYLDRPDVFNVTITRARSYQYVFCSVPPGDFPPDSLLRRYLESIGDETSECSRETAPEAREGGPSFDDDPFLNEVREALAQEGCETWAGWPVAGLRVDLVVRRDDRFLGIDLVGRPGATSDAHSLDRYRMVTRAGLELVPLSYSRWCRDREACLSELRSRLEACQQERAILPM